MADTTLPPKMLSLELLIDRISRTSLYYLNRSQTRYASLTHSDAWKLFLIGLTFKDLDGTEQKE